VSEVQEPQGSIGNTLLIFLLGVAVGATVAILYAPAAGSETRAQIAEKAGQLKDKASQLSSQVAEKASEWKDRASAMLHRAEQQGGENGDSATSVTQKLADVVSDTTRS